MNGIFISINSNNNGYIISNNRSYFTNPHRNVINWDSVTFKLEENKSLNELQQGLIKKYNFINFEENLIANIIDINKTDNILFGIIDFQSKTQYGKDKDGKWLTLFKPLNNLYPSLLVKTKKRYTNNCYASVKITKSEINNKYMVASCENIYGEVGNKEVDLESCLHQYGIFFKKNKIHNFDIEQLTKLDDDRENFTEHNIISIDSSETKDIDDAISIEKKDDSIFLFIHIADASYFATSDKNIFKVASENICSFYLPHKKLNMIPNEISENNCSLVQDKRRYALTTMIEFDNNYNIKSSKVNKSIIINKNRITYIQADKLINQKKKSKLSEDLNMLNILSKNIASNFKINISDNYSHNEKQSRRIIEILMNLNNMVVATLISEKIPYSILRIQNNDKNTFDNINSNVKNEELKKILKYLNYNKSYYTVRKNTKESLINHESLGIKYYTHFTSPIRRFVDLWNHICIKKLINKESIENFQNNINFNIENQINFINLKHYYYKLAYRQIELVNIYHNYDYKKEGEEGIIIDLDIKSITIYLLNLKRIIHVKLINKELNTILDSKIQDNNLTITNKNNNSQFLLNKFSEIKVKIFKNSSKIKWKDKIIFQLISPNYSEWLLNNN